MDPARTFVDAARLVAGCDSSRAFAGAIVGANKGTAPPTIDQSFVCGTALATSYVTAWRAWSG